MSPAKRGSAAKMSADAKAPGADPEYVVPVPEDMSLPSAAIQRIIKTKLPDGVMIGKEAKVAFSKSASIFILYVTTMCAREGPPPLPWAHAASHALSGAPVPPRPTVGPPATHTTHGAQPVRCSCARSANDLAKESRRTTVTAQDVLNALRDLEFDEFLPSMEACLHAYKEQEKQKSLENAAKRASKGGGGGADDAGGDEDEAEEDDDAGADEAEPQSKRQRTDGDDEDAE